MFARTALSFALWLQVARGQSIPEKGPQPFIPDLEGDILFLLDSSGSVSYYEFSKVKEFIRDLLRPFTFGPHDVQTSIIHISTVPTIEFPFDRYPSSEAVQQAIRGTQQLMGDTNTGKALSFAKEKFFTDEAGSRPDVPKVLVWVTDGFSTDDISPPMQLLKDMGVTVFIVSTGRGNFLELSAAASQPPEQHLHFVDVDDLPIITKELRDAITEVIRATRLRAVDITSSSFRLMWPKLLSSGTGYYVLEHTPAEEPRRKLTQQVSGDRTSLLLNDLAPETTYKVVLIPESNTHYIPPQTTRVTTLQEEISPNRIVISESTPHSFQVSWSPTPDSVVSYQVLYGPLPGNSAKLLEVDGKQNSTVLENLTPNTTYLVTVAAIYKSGKERALSAKACTQGEGSKVKHLRFEDMGPNTLKASWDSADGKVLGYRVRCRRQTGPSSLISVSPQVHSVLLTDLAAGTTNKVCVKPMYKDQAGKGLCRMVHMQPATEAQGYTRRRRA
ncbi:PREDICTED: von Willebrand factor A domain-containing protein 1 isoform X2 [Gavialis gangeticus]|uniref:von Willebrand factor A domain-containing protein 1 isoform X2 n=1 Tax=Gavialis gangeticus TaxID=94835 RepID=UPI00092F22A5|nr:PREDICTED: von Willebrand factor A domain-containing protein 1 isoform X2 [Gavialis gangeticus]